MDEREFDDFYTASFQRITGQVYAMIGDRDEAQEVVQEAFVRAWAHRRKLEKAEHPEAWFAASVDAPLLIIPHSSKDAYLDRYALPDKGFADRSDAWWPAPYWDIDTGFASLLMLLTAVDAGLGACFFGIPVDQINAFREAFGVPAQFTPIGAISVGYSNEPPRDLSSRRKPAAETVHKGRWSPE